MDYLDMYKRLQMLRENPQKLQTVLKALQFTELEFIELIWLLADKALIGACRTSRKYIPLNERGGGDEKK